MGKLQRLRQKRESMLASRYLAGVENNDAAQQPQDQQQQNGYRNSSNGNNNRGYLHHSSRQGNSNRRQYRHPNNNSDDEDTSPSKKSLATTAANTSTTTASTSVSVSPARNSNSSTTPGSSNRLRGLKDNTYSHPHNQHALLEEYEAEYSGIDNSNRHDDSYSYDDDGSEEDDDHIYEDSYETTASSSINYSGSNDINPLRKQLGRSLHSGIEYMTKNWDPCRVDTTSSNHHPQHMNLHPHAPRYSSYPSSPGSNRGLQQQQQQQPQYPHHPRQPRSPSAAGFKRTTSIASGASTQVATNRALDLALDKIARMDSENNNEEPRPISVHERYQLALQQQNGSSMKSAGVAAGAPVQPPQIQAPQYNRYRTQQPSPKHHPKRLAFGTPYICAQRLEATSILSVSTCSNSVETEQQDDLRQHYCGGGDNANSQHLQASLHNMQGKLQHYVQQSSKQQRQQQQLLQRGPVDCDDVSNSSSQDESNGQDNSYHQHGVVTSPTDEADDDLDINDRGDDDRQVIYSNDNYYNNDNDTLETGGGSSLGVEIAAPSHFPSVQEVLQHQQPQDVLRRQQSQPHSYTTRELLQQQRTISPRLVSPPPQRQSMKSPNSEQGVILSPTITSSSSNAMSSNTRSARIGGVSSPLTITTPRTNLCESIDNDNQLTDLSLSRIQDTSAHYLSTPVLEEDQVKRQSAAHPHSSVLSSPSMSSTGRSVDPVFCRGSVIGAGNSTATGATTEASTPQYVHRQLRLSDHAPQQPLVGDLDELLEYTFDDDQEKASKAKGRGHDDDDSYDGDDSENANSDLLKHTLAHNQSSSVEEDDDDEAAPRNNATDETQDSSALMSQHRAAIMGRLAEETTSSIMNTTTEDQNRQDPSSNHGCDEDELAAEIMSYTVSQESQTKHNPSSSRSPAASRRPASVLSGTLQQERASSATRTRPSSAMSNLRSKSPIVGVVKSLGTPRLRPASTTSIGTMRRAAPIQRALRNSNFAEHQARSESRQQRASSGYQARYDGREDDKNARAKSIEPGVIPSVPSHSPARSTGMHPFSRQGQAISKVAESVARPKSPAEPRATNKQVHRELSKTPLRTSRPTSPTRSPMRAKSSHSIGRPAPSSAGRRTPKAAEAFLSAVSKRSTQFSTQRPRIATAPTPVKASPASRLVSKLGIARNSQKMDDDHVSVGLQSQASAFDSVGNSPDRQQGLEPGNIAPASKAADSAEKETDMQKARALFESSNSKIASLNKPRSKSAPNSTRSRFVMEPNPTNPTALATSGANGHSLSISDRIKRFGEERPSNSRSNTPKSGRTNVDEKRLSQESDPNEVKQGSPPADEKLPSSSFRDSVNLFSGRKQAEAKVQEKSSNEFLGRVQRFGPATSPVRPRTAFPEEAMSKSPAVVLRPVAVKANMSKTKLEPSVAPALTPDASTAIRPITPSSARERASRVDASSSKTPSRPSSSVRDRVMQFSTADRTTSHTSNVTRPVPISATSLLVAQSAGEKDSPRDGAVAPFVANTNDKTLASTMQGSPSRSELNHSDFETDSEYTDGVTLDLSIAEVSNLTTPTALMSNTDEICHVPPRERGHPLAKRKEKKALQLNGGEESSTESPKEPAGSSEVLAKRSVASSTQASEAAAPLIAPSMRNKPMSDDLSAGDSFFAARARVMQQWSKDTEEDSGEGAALQVIRRAERYIAEEKKDAVEPTTSPTRRTWDTRRVDSVFPEKDSKSHELFEFESGWQQFEGEPERAYFQRDDDSQGMIPDEMEKKLLRGPSRGLPVAKSFDSGRSKTPTAQNTTRLPQHAERSDGAMSFRERAVQAALQSNNVPFTEYQSHSQYYDSLRANPMQSHHPPPDHPPSVNHASPHQSPASNATSLVSPPTFNEVFGRTNPRYRDAVFEGAHPAAPPGTASGANAQVAPRRLFENGGAPQGEYRAPEPSTTAHYPRSDPGVDPRYTYNGSIGQEGRYPAGYYNPPPPPPPQPVYQHHAVLPGQQRQDDSRYPSSSHHHRHPGPIPQGGYHHPPPQSSLPERKQWQTTSEAGSSSDHQRYPPVPPPHHHHPQEQQPQAPPQQQPQHPHVQYHDHHNSIGNTNNNTNSNHHQQQVRVRLQSLKESRMRRSTSTPAAAAAGSGYRMPHGYQLPSERYRMREPDDYSNSTMSSTRFGGSTFLSALDVD